MSRVYEAVTTSESRLAAQSTTLTQLTEWSATSTAKFDDRLATILRMAAETLDVDRLSLWRFADDGQEIRCDRLFSRASDRYEVGARIRRDTCPGYFDALQTDRVIAAHDAHGDPRTSCFLES